MTKLVRNILLLGKQQPTLDTDPSPAAAANAMLAGNFTVNAIESEFADRFNVQAYMGNSGKVQISQKSSISFDVELASAGAAGEAPAFGVLLRACAMDETLTASTDAVYTPVTTGHEMATLYYYLDGILFKMLNAKGTFVIDVSAGGIPKFTFTFTGSFSTPTDTSLPTDADYSNFQAPLGINKANTPTFTLHGTAFKAEALTVDIANNVVYRNLIGAETIVITDRKPTGSVTIETESVATKNFYNIVRQGTLGALQFVHGSTPGYICQIYAPKVQITAPNFSDSDGVSMMGMTLELLPDTGNDELVLTFK